MPINTIIFDLGGVLIDWNPEYVFKQVIPDDDKRQYFFENICTHEWNIEQDAGRTLHEATETKVAEFPEALEKATLSPAFSAPIMSRALSASPGVPPASER